MKTARLPAVIFGSLLFGYAAFLACTFSNLPGQMATHFDAHGQPNGWMPRSVAITFQAIVGMVLPLVIAAFFGAIRLMPMRSINLPRRDYWFSPERRDATCAYLARQGLWLASLIVVLQAAVWYQILESNRASTKHFSLTSLFIVLSVFTIALIGWVIGLFRHFARAG
jgi:uncharacterized membrane protein